MSGSFSRTLIETETDWVLTGFSHPNYLAEFGANSIRFNPQ